MRSHRKLPTTAQMVLEETSRKSTFCRFISRSASAVLFAGAAILVSPAMGQETEEPARYAPPVHIQPVAWSVLESEETLADQPKPRPPQQRPQQQPRPPQQNSVSRSNEIANMAEYMRRQNEYVTRSQDAQVNAALNQLQASKTLAAQGYRQTVPAQPVQGLAAFPRTSPPPAAVQQQFAQQQQQLAQQQLAQQQVAQQQQLAQQQELARRQQQQRAQRQVRTNPQVAQRRTSPALPQTQPWQNETRKAVGLQDRISTAFKKRFTRPQNPQPARAQVNVARQVPVHATRVPQAPTPKQHSPVALVDHTTEARTVDAPAVVLPTLADEPVIPQLAQKRPKRAPKTEYRSGRSLALSEQVIVPSFVDDEADALPELRLASSQDVIGSGVRRPEVSSHSRPMSYGSATKQEPVSVFRNAGAKRVPQDGEQDLTDEERLRQLQEELDNGKPGLDSELPPRSSTDDEPSLLDLDDEDAAEEARRARSALDAELDDLIDDDEDPFDEDEDSDGPPVFDERGCEELRGLLLDTSIRDISLDISPPASPRRAEIENLTRSWTDPSGTVLATGTMIDLRRGYVILDSGLKLPYAKLSEADWAAIHENWLLPSVCSVGQRGSVQRNWAPQTVSWHASSLCHKPLYFENVQLERYGHSRGPYMQPVHSTLHFFKSILFLPYKTAINPPNECQYALGFYRPGNCAPWLLDPIPFSRAGIRRQALASVGLAFIP